MEQFAEFLSKMARVMLAERVDGFGIIRCPMVPGDPGSDIFAYQRRTSVSGFIPYYLRLNGEIGLDEIEPSGEEDVYGVRLRSYVAGAFKGLTGLDPTMLTTSPYECLNRNRAGHFARMLNDLEADRFYMGYHNDFSHGVGYGFCLRKLICGERAYRSQSFRGKVSYRAGYINSNPGFDAKDQYWFTLGGWENEHMDAYVQAIKAIGKLPQTGIGRSTWLKDFQEPFEGITCHYYR